MVQIKNCSFKISILLVFITIFPIFGFKFQAGLSRNSITIDDNAVITITISGNDVKNPPYPTFEKSNDFTLISKNSSSSSSRSISIVNGKMTNINNNQITQTITFKPNKVGNLKLPGFIFNYLGKKEQRGATPINVLKESPDAKFIRFSLKINKRKLFINESAVVTAIIQKQQNSPIGNISLPDVVSALKKNFWVKMITDGNKIPVSHEQINGIPYETHTIKYLIFPLLPGKIKIPSIPISFGIIQNNRRSRDPFASFFNNRNQIQKTKSSIPIFINVSSLPANNNKAYSGAVGNFSLAISTDKKELKAGEAINLRITIKGSGNSKTVGKPIISNANEFEIFDPEISTKEQISNNINYVSKTFKYVIIPQKEGIKKIGPVTFEYFNPKTKQYQIASALISDLKISKGKAKEVTKYLTKEEIRIVGKDIRYINTDFTNLKKKPNRYYTYPIYWMILFSPFILLFLILSFKNSSDKIKGNSSLLRRKKAINKALKLLKTTKINISDNKIFYSSILKSLTNFVADKAEICGTEITEENLINILKNKKIDDSIISKVSKTFNECSFFSYAGQKGSTEKEVLIVETKLLIEKLEKLL